MEKNNKTKIVAVISSLILLLLVIGASFAYFGSFETNLNNNVAVNIITASPGNATFISNATFLDLNVSASKMDLMNSDDNTPALTNEANLIISLTSGSDSLKTTCTYDIIYEYDYNSKVYGAGEEVVTSGATKEITLEVKGNGGTNNYSEEKNFNYDSLWTAKDDTNKKGPKKVLVSSVTIENSSANTPTVQNFTFTGRYYNLSLNQRQLINKSFTGKIYAESKGCVTKEKTLAYQTILAKNIINEGKPDFTQVATTNEGIYKTEDDLGTSYYFRGAVDNNWVKFGQDGDGKDIYWRIIRINGDGSIRMIYTGITPPTEEQKVKMTGEGTQIGVSFYAVSSGNYSNKPWYVGYMYTSGKQFGITKESNVKLFIDNWYKNTTMETDDAVKKLVSDQIFCNDRSIGDTSLETLVSNGDYVYNGQRRDNSPSLKCNNILDRFTVSENNGNGALTYPVGLITSDEVDFSGAEPYSNNYFLVTGLNYWTMTPWGFHKIVYMIIVGSGGLCGHTMTSDGNTQGELGVRPVINISADASISGDGTWNNPYIFN